MKLFNKQRIITRCLRGMLAVIILSAMLGLAACGADTGSPENEARAGTEKDGIQDNSHALGSSGIQEGSVRPDSSFIPDNDTDRPAANEPKRLLTEDELRGFEEYLNRTDNYGFLMSDYQSPEYINLNEVFYSGAGLEQFPLTEEERDMYLKTVGQPELYTDLVRRVQSRWMGSSQRKQGCPLTG